jgi:hypothetical protein
VQGARFIHYPANVVDVELRDWTIPATEEGGYGSMVLARARPDLFYRRPDNFQQGDLGSVVVYGSPLRGSPFGNEVTHEICAPDLRARCFDPNNVPPLLSRRRAVYSQASDPSRTQADAGAAIYDLAMGGSAYGLFHELDSEPVRVHAIGTTASLLSGPPIQWVTHPEDYCPGFDRTTSDRIVPLESQLANFAPSHRTLLRGPWHNAQDSFLPLRETVVRLLVDLTTSAQDPATRYARNFAADSNCYPLQCGAQQCQPMQ